MEASNVRRSSSNQSANNNRAPRNTAPPQRNDSQNFNAQRQEGGRFPSQMRAESAAPERQSLNSQSTRTRNNNLPGSLLRPVNSSSPTERPDSSNNQLSSGRVPSANQTPQWQINDGHKITGEVFSQLSPNVFNPDTSTVPADIRTPYSPANNNGFATIAYGVGSAVGLAAAGGPLGFISGAAFLAGSGNNLINHIKGTAQAYNPNIDYSNLSESARTALNVTTLGGGARYLNEHFNQQASAYEGASRQINGGNAGQYILSSLNSGAALSGSATPLFGDGGDRPGGLTQAPATHHPAQLGALPFQIAHSVPGTGQSDWSHPVINSFRNNDSTFNQLERLNDDALNTAHRIVGGYARENSAHLSNVGQGITETTENFFQERDEFNQSYQRFQAARAEYESAKSNAYNYYFGASSLDNISEEQARKGLDQLSIEASRGGGTRGDSQGYFAVYDNGANTVGLLQNAERFNNNALNSAASENKQVFDLYNNKVTNHVVDVWSDSKSVRLKGLNEAPHDPANALRVISKYTGYLVAPEKTGHSLTNPAKQNVLNKLQGISDQNPAFFNLLARPEVRDAGFKTRGTESNFNLQDNFSRVRRTNGIRHADWTRILGNESEGTRVKWTKDFTQYVSNIRSELVNQQQAYQGSTNNLLDLQVRNPFSPDSWNLIRTGS